jgi:hypothetical protein
MVVHAMASRASLMKSVARGHVARKRGHFPLEVDVAAVIEALTMSDMHAARLERITATTLAIARRLRRDLSDIEQVALDELLQVQWHPRELIMFIILLVRMREEELVEIELETGRLMPRVTRLGVGLIKLLDQLVRLERAEILEMKFKRNAGELEILVFDEGATAPDPPLVLEDELSAADLMPISVPEDDLQMVEPLSLTDEIDGDQPGQGEPLGHEVLANEPVSGRTDQKSRTA